MRKEKKLEIDQIKKIELDILDFVVDICNKNGLKYFLHAGTLLGAIRHQGYIPWDDDIDILLPRADYNRFISIMKDSLRYKVLSIQNIDDYIYPFAKVVDTNTILRESSTTTVQDLGVYIDVFPLDALPTEKMERIRFQNKIWRLKKMQAYSILKNRGKEKLHFKVLKLYCKAIGSKRFLKRINQMLMMYNLDEEKFCADIAGATKKYIACPKDIFIDTKQVVFEGEKYNAPIGAEKYLTCLYGDYMKVPPIEEQVTHHNFIAYLK